VAQQDVAVLVEAAASGDQQAWNALVERFSGLVWHVARAHRLGTADAADVAQTVWLRLVESLPRLRDPAAVGGWLATTTRYECLRVLRLAGREVAEDSVELDRPSDNGQSPEAIVERGERRALVSQALDRLSLRCRTLLLALAYAPDRSYAEISSALGMPVGSIGPTRGRCLEHLRRELVADGALTTGEGAS
jgi:RNA polymerase sigma factor (sigma-70 family)